MTEENFRLQSDQNLEYYLVTIFEKIENIRSESIKVVDNSKSHMQVEIRTLEFWRSVISECFASFIYVFVVCGAAAGAGVGANSSMSSVLVATSLAAGFVVTSLTQCFGHISGAHVNPSVSIAMGVIKRISLLRSILFILAQCGGGIAGAALLYRVSALGYQGSLLAINPFANASPWDRFGIEFVMTFIVVLSYLVSMDTYRKWNGTSSIAIGSTYAACSLVSMPFLNPARSLGPSFVLNRWDDHWVYWVGPLLGGVTAALIYEYIFNIKHHKTNKDLQNDESSSIHSDEIDTYDDIDKPTPPKFSGSTYNNYRPTTGAAQNCCGSLYSVPPAKLERGESIYGGTKSLYCNSPPLTRANLNRSQSVYAKSNTGISKDILPKPGPLVPTQSMYPLRLHQQSHVQNQNLQNQLQQRSESVYGIRGVTPGTATNRSDNHGTMERQRDNYSTITESQRSSNYPTADRKRRDNYITTENPYGTSSNPPSEISSKFEENTTKPTRRPESMYGLLASQTRSRVTTQSDDSTYSSYTANSSSRNTNSSTVTSYHNSQNSTNYQSKSATGNYTGPPGLRNITSSEPRSNQPTQLLTNASNSTSYHHQHSPIPQY